MQPRSALFDQTIAGPHTLLTRADILSGGKVVATGLPVVGGSVTGDRRQFARRTCAVTIGDPTYKPQGIVNDLLAPYGNEIRLWRGAQTPAGPELICVGTFGIRAVEFDSGGAFAGIAVTGIDRCKALAESRFPYPRTSASLSASAVGLIRGLILEVFPWAEVRVDRRVPDVMVPPVTWQSSRDQAILDLATSIGCEVFCDPYGAFIIQPIPALAGPPAFTVAAGPGGVLVSSRHTLSRDGVFNGIVARGSTTDTGQDPPFSDLVVDDDPTSPTYWYGNFRQIVGYYDSSLLVTPQQCNIAAKSLLQNNIGLARSINYAQAVNPAVEPGDVGAVVDPDTGITEYHLHDQVTIPLDAGGVMTAQTRSTLTASPAPTVYPGSLT